MKRKWLEKIFDAKEERTTQYKWGNNRRNDDYCVCIVRQRSVEKRVFYPLGMTKLWWICWYLHSVRMRWQRNSTQIKSTWRWQAGRQANVCMWPCACNVLPNVQHSCLCHINVCTNICYSCARRRRSAHIEKYQQHLTLPCIHHFCAGAYKISLII